MSDTMPTGATDAAWLRRAAKDATEIERLRGVCEDWAHKYESWRGACIAAEAERDAARAAVEGLRERVGAVVDECDRRLERETDRVLSFWNRRLRAALDAE